MCHGLQSLCGKNMQCRGQSVLCQMPISSLTNCIKDLGQVIWNLWSPTMLRFHNHFTAHWRQYVEVPRRKRGGKLILNRSRCFLIFLSPLSTHLMHSSQPVISYWCSLNSHKPLPLSEKSPKMKFLPSYRKFTHKELNKLHRNLNERHCSPMKQAKVAIAAENFIEVRQRHQVVWLRSLIG